MISKLLLGTLIAVMVTSCIIAIPRALASERPDIQASVPPPGVFYQVHVFDHVCIAWHMGRTTRHDRDPQTLGGLSCLHISMYPENWVLYSVSEACTMCFMNCPESCLENVKVEE